MYYLGWAMLLTFPHSLTLSPPSLPPPLVTVRERLDKLELLTERDRGSADNTADSTNTSYVVATETPQTTLPQKIMKIKNNSTFCGSDRR